MCCICIRLQHFSSIGDGAAVLPGPGQERAAGKGGSHTRGCVQAWIEGWTVSRQTGRQVVWWVPHQRVRFGDSTSCRAPNGRLMTLLESPGPHLLLRSHLRPPGIFGDRAARRASLSSQMPIDGCQKLRSFSACQQQARHHQLSPLGRQEKKKTTRRNSQVSPPLDESFVHLMWQHLGRV